MQKLVLRIYLYTEEFPIWFRSYGGTVVWRVRDVCSTRRQEAQVSCRRMLHI